MNLEVNGNLTPTSNKSNLFPSATVFLPGKHDKKISNQPTQSYVVPSLCQPQWLPYGRNGLVSQQLRLCRSVTSGVLHFLQEESTHMYNRTQSHKIASYGGWFGLVASLRPAEAMQNGTRCREENGEQKLLTNTASHRIQPGLHNTSAAQRPFPV